MPLSITVGTSGSAGLRSLLVTARARTLPCLWYDAACGMLSAMNCTCPPMRSVNAGALPR